MSYSEISTELEEKITYAWDEIDEILNMLKTLDFDGLVKARYKLIKRAEEAMCFLDPYVNQEIISQMHGLRLDFKNPNSPIFKGGIKFRKE